MARSDGPEAAVVERGGFHEAEAFGDGDDGGVGRAEARREKKGCRRWRGPSAANPCRAGRRGPDRKTLGRLGNGVHGYEPLDALTESRLLVGDRRHPLQVLERTGPRSPESVVEVAPQTTATRLVELAEAEYRVLVGEAHPASASAAARSAERGRPRRQRDGERGGKTCAIRATAGPRADRAT
jgi:hypothetical protein